MYDNSSDSYVPCTFGSIKTRRTSSMLSCNSKFLVVSVKCLQRHDAQPLGNKNKFELSLLYVCILINVLFFLFTGNSYFFYISCFAKKYCKPYIYRVRFACMRKASIIRVIGGRVLINIRQHLIRFDHARARARAIDTNTTELCNGFRIITSLCVSLERNMMVDMVSWYRVDRSESYRLDTYAHLRLRGTVGNALYIFIKRLLYVPFKRFYTAVFT